MDGERQSWLSLDAVEPLPEAEVHALKYEPDDCEDEPECERVITLGPRAPSAVASLRLALCARRCRAACGIARTARARV